MFDFHTVAGGITPAFEPIPVGNITPKLGMALCYDSSTNKYAIAYGANKKAEYICMEEHDSAMGDSGGTVAAIKVQPYMVFESQSASSFASVHIGDKVQIASGGLTLSNSTTNGTATVVAKPEGSATGESILVRFE